jgi:hypothetical protein
MEGQEPQKESKNERFKRIVTYRTNKILDGLRLLGNCSNKVTYSYSDDEVKKIFDRVEEEVKQVKNLFITKKEKFEL